MLRKEVRSKLWHSDLLWNYTMQVIDYGLLCANTTDFNQYYNQDNFMSRFRFTHIKYNVELYHEDQLTA